MSQTSLNWAEHLGYRSADPYYEQLAIVILVEEYGIKKTAETIRQSESYVRAKLAGYEIASMPRLKTSKADYKKAMKRIYTQLKKAGFHNLIVKYLSEKIEKSTEEIEELLK